MKVPVICNHCSNDDVTLMEHTGTVNRFQMWWCIVCGKNFHVIVPDESRPDNQANQISKQQPK